MKMMEVDTQAVQGDAICLARVVSSRSKVEQVFFPPFISLLYIKLYTKQPKNPMIVPEPFYKAVSQ